MWLAALLLAAAASLVLIWTDARLLRARPPRAQRFLLIICDALRADHVGCYGSDKNLTPFIDAFAKRAVRFENAYAAAPWTLPSNVAAMTGRYPHDVQLDRFRRGRGEVPMARYFQAAGFRTAAFSSAGVISPVWGFARGFDSFVYRRLEDDMVANACIRWLGWHRDDRFFVLLYLFDPHWPYDPEKPGAHLIPRDAHVRKIVAQGHIPLPRTTRVPRIVRRPREEHEMSMEEVEYLHALYDGDVVSVDERIGRVLAAAAEIPGLVIVVTADHGEEWLDHGGLSHLFTLYDELLRIPLILFAPGQRAATMSDPVSNLDLLPTLLSLARIDAGRELPGMSLLPVRKLSPRPLFAEVPATNPALVLRFSARQDNRVLIWTKAALRMNRNRRPGADMNATTWPETRASSDRWRLAAKTMPFPA